MADMPPVNVRFLRDEDLDEVLRCEERLLHADPDFDVKQMPAYAWDRNDILEAVGQYRSQNLGTNDTRSFAAEVLVERDDGTGLTEDVPWVCGAMVYEIQQDGYEILFFTAQTGVEGFADHVRLAMLLKLSTKAAHSEARKRLSVMVPDGDDETLRFFQNQGWDVKLRLNPTGTDAWHCEYRLPTEEEQDSPQAVS
jgi:hypothetical protein